MVTLFVNTENFIEEEGNFNDIMYILSLSGSELDVVLDGMELLKDKMTDPDAISYLQRFIDDIKESKFRENPR